MQKVLSGLKNILFYFLGLYEIYINMFSFMTNYTYTY